ncbi:hypothetical protein A9P82_08830 [Arachidicoccus ginsenosidimutans]|nr:hypothetical protein A9P82_08830 [Arachidicoccus sp. BS20]
MLPSCKKFLDKKQNASAVVPSTLSDIQALLDEDIMIESVSPSYMEASSDEYFLTDDVYSSFSEYGQDMYTWVPFTVTAANSSNDWHDSYYPVYNANLALDLIKNIDRNSANAAAWDNAKGSALFYRSYNFLNLLWDYSKAYDSSTADKDLGIALRLTSDFNVPSARATVQQSYKQVISDTKAAIPLLPDYPLALTRPSKGAAYGLLARCYLSMRDYKDALSYADSCLQLNNSLIDFNGDEDIIGSIANDEPFKRLNKETVFYTTMNYEYDIFSYVGNIDTAILRSYDSNDLRLIAYFGDNGTGSYFKASYGNDYFMNFTGIAVDEMYLTRAECYIRTGQVQKGLDDINTLLSKRYKTGTYVPPTGLSQNDALTRALLERRKELLLRDNRWMDIKRLNKEGANIILKRIIAGKTYTLQPNANFYALPLPEDIIRTTGMPQNPL